MEKLSKSLKLSKELFARIPIRNRIFIIGDLLLITVAVLGSFAIRFELGALFVFYLPQANMMLLLALIIKPVIFYIFGLYRRLWAYASIRELTLVVTAVAASSVALSVAVTAVIYYQAQMPGYIGFPRMALVIDWLLTTFLVGGFRFSSRLLAEVRSTAANGSSSLRIRRALIVGAGDAGALVVREIQKNPQLQLIPVCFLDDDTAKQKQQIHGIPVVGTLDDLEKEVRGRFIQEVIIAIPTATGQIVRQVADACRRTRIPFRTMPGMYELIGGRVSVNRLRDVNITDLLRRAPARIDEARIASSLGGRRILVTGAGGSIGWELCRQIARWGPSMVILLGHGENSIFEAVVDLEDSFPSIPFYPIVADIRDIDRLTSVFDNFQPQMVFHAAAHKHVPLMEVNVEEAITNNIGGTRNLVEVAHTFGVDKLVMISSDKAICPSSVMGATKRIAELLVLDAANNYGIAFSAVRFGNVLGSRGSVVPRFKKQIAKGGPVTVTHPDMERYFMTIPEAVHLVLQASTMGEGGEVFVLNMGKQVRILSLAEDVIRLSGLEPGKDIPIVFTGIRAGEKLSEELWDQGAQYEPTTHSEIVMIRDENVLRGDELLTAVDELIHYAREGEASAIVKRLDEIIPGSAIRITPPPEMTSVV